MRREDGEMVGVGKEGEGGVRREGEGGCEKRGEGGCEKVGRDGCEMGGGGDDGSRERREKMGVRGRDDTMEM